MAAPTYQAEFSIGLLGTISNLLSQPMNFYRCNTCGAVIAEGQTGTAGRDLHTTWHAALDTTATAASAAGTKATQAASDASAAKTAATASASSAATAASDSTAAKTAASAAATSASASAQSAGTASNAAGSALTAAQNAQTAADRSSTNAQDSAADARLAEDAATASAASLAALAEATGMCPLCRAEVAKDKISLHLTYHYRRAHGDPVEFPADFDPTTADMDQVDPPMRVANSAPQTE